MADEGRVGFDEMTEEELFWWLQIQAAMVAAHYATGGEQMAPQAIIDLPESRATAKIPDLRPEDVGKLFYMARTIGLAQIDFSAWGLEKVLETF